MKNPLDITVSLFRGAKNPVPIDTVNLYDWLRSSEYKSAIEKIRNAANADDVARLKKKLPAVTPSGEFNRRAANGLIRHSGLICIDIDAEPNADVRDFDNLKDWIAACPYVAWCSRSASGRGFFAMILISTPDKHKAHFESLEKYFARAGVTIDGGCGDVCRLRFASFDATPRINLNAETYDYIIEPRRAQPRRKSNRRPSGKTAKEVADIIETIVANGVDITGPYGQWFEIGCALANEFGENARQWWHTISQFGDYDPAECDYKFDEALKVNGYSIASFFHYAGLYGLTGKAADPIAEAREVFKEYLK